MRAGAERERIGSGHLSDRLRYWRPHQIPPPPSFSFLAGAGPPSLALRAFYRYPLETTWIAKRGAR